MARIRTIKPEFWESEKVGKMSILGRLSFLGLISMADDEGRGRGDQTYLRARLHAYAADVQPGEFARALREIRESHLAHFYEASGCSYYAIPGWAEHQKVEKPRPSTIPAPAGDSGNDPRLFPESSPEEGNGREGNGMEGKGRDRGLPGVGQEPANPAPPSPRDLFDLWNRSVAGSAIPQAKELNRDRTAKARVRLGERTLEQWGEIFARMARTPFLNGNNDRNWRASFDWIIANASNSSKVIEGKYDQIDRRPDAGARNAGYAAPTGTRPRIIDN